MNEKLEEQLYQRYPSLYRNRFPYGFSCGDGWYPLIDVISELLTKHDQGIYAVQVKEKFGGLRFYHMGGDNYTLGLRKTAEALSNTICDICGAPGVLNNNKGGWATLCEAHGGPSLTIDNHDIDISSVADLGLGTAWSRHAVILKQSADQYTEQAGKPRVTFHISKENERLMIEPSTDDEIIAGMVDIVVGYANRIDECSGAVVVNK
jgi:hypothetical protein